MIRLLIDREMAIDSSNRGKILTHWSASDWVEEVELAKPEWKSYTVHIGEGVALCGMVKNA